MIKNNNKYNFTEEEQKLYDRLIIPFSIKTYRSIKKKYYMFRLNETKNQLETVLEIFSLIKK